MDNPSASKCGSCSACGNCILSTCFGATRVLLVSTFLTYFLIMKKQAVPSSPNSSGDQRCFVQRLLSCRHLHALICQMTNVQDCSACATAHVRLLYLMRNWRAGCICILGWQQSSVIRAVKLMRFDSAQCCGSTNTCLLGSTGGSTYAHVQHVSLECFCVC